MKTTKRFALALVGMGLMTIANGCCSLPGGPLCGVPQICLTRPDKFVSDQCCDGSGCADCAKTDIGSCDGNCGGTCGRDECCLFRNLGQKMRSALSCGSGCSDVYWSSWYNDPPDECDPCGCYGEFIGPQHCLPRFCNWTRLLWGGRGEDCYTRPHRCATGHCGGNCATGNCGGGFAPGFGKGEVIIEGPVTETWESDSPPTLEIPTPAAVTPTSGRSITTARNAGYGRTRTVR